MSQALFIHTRNLLLMSGTLLILTSCASHPRYGASPRHKRGCDCPKWNAAPELPGKDIRIDASERPKENMSLNDGHHY